MFTIRYNGMYIHGSWSKDFCYVPDDTHHFFERRFKSLLAAKQVITKARNAGVPASR